MKLTYSKSQFDVPEGQYTVRFDGVENIEPKPGEAPRLGQDGKPMAPGMAWRFVIVEGSENGKKADRITSRNPTTKNLCGRFLVAITGQILKDGMEIDLDLFKGKFYRINVVEKEQGNGTCVSDQGIVPVAGPTPASPNGQHAPAAGPPPRRSSSAPPAGPTYWVDYEGIAGDPPVMTEDAFRKWYGETQAKAVNLCPTVGPQQWKPADELFTDLIPW